MNSARPHILLSLSLALGVAGCSNGEPVTNVPGDAMETQAYDGIAEGETIRVTGTEPFWGGDISAGTFTYSTPENIDGEKLAVTRFAGRGGVSFSGTNAEGGQVDIAITPGDCSDGMSDRTYPFNATLDWAGDARSGCAWTDAQPFAELEY